MSRRAVLIEALGATPRDLARMLRPVAPEAALIRPAPDSWCVAELVAHLAEVEARYLERLRRVVGEENPTVPAINADPRGQELNRSLAELAALFVERRAATIAFLASLEQRDWGRHLLHETLGPTRLRDQVQALVAHDNEHLEQMTTLRAALDH